MAISEMADEEQMLLLKLEELGSNGEEDGTTSVLIFSIFVAVCGSFVSGSAIGYTSPVQSGILAELGLSIADYSLFGSMLTVGALLSSLVCGMLTDYIGRRLTIALADMLFLAGWLSIACSQGAWSLDLGRLVLGFAFGLIGYVVPVYVAEITPKNLRGGSVLLHQLMLSSGVAFVYTVGLMTSWRILSLLGIIPCMVQLLSLFLIPESPRWLANINRDECCETALKRLRGDKSDVSQELASIKESIEDLRNISEDGFRSLFQMKYAHSLVVTLGLIALAGLSGACGFAFYASAIFESAGISNTLGTVSSALIQLPPIVLGVFLMDNFGRRPLLLFSASGMCTACFCLASSFLMKEHGWMKEFSPYFALLGFLIAAATYSVGMGGIPYVIMSEIFPMNVKGTVGNLTIVVGSASTWIVSYTFNILMAWSLSGTFFIFTSINIFAVLFVAKLVPETKGRTLEELQKSLT